MHHFINLKAHLIVCAMLIAIISVNAQTNIRTFTPSSTIRDGSFQAKWFNSLFTQTKERDKDGETRALNGRQSYFTSTLQTSYGVTDRFNIGVDAVFTRFKLDSTSTTSPLGVFGKGSEFSKSRLSYFGPSIKIAPITSVPRLSYQATLWIPIGANLESPQFIADDQYIWYNRFFYDRNISKDLLIFLEADLNYRFVRKSLRTNYLRTPISVFLSYFPQDKLTFFINGQYSPRFEKLPKMTKFFFSQWYTQVGLGGKYQLTKAWELEFSYAKFVAAKNDGAGDIINLGLRYLR